MLAASTESPPGTQRSKPGGMEFFLVTRLNQDQLKIKMLIGRLIEINYFEEMQH